MHKKSGKNVPPANAHSLDVTGYPRQRFQEQFIRHGLVPPRIRLVSESRLGFLSLVKQLGTVCTFPVRPLDELSFSCSIACSPVQEKAEALDNLDDGPGRSIVDTAGTKLAFCIRYKFAIAVREWGMGKERHARAIGPRPQSPENPGRICKCETCDPVHRHGNPSRCRRQERFRLSACRSPEPEACCRLASAAHRS